ncbi:MAG: winged helix DNA-binding domain-containing protein [Propioniciclava sp.]|uniref:winged helix DNA-binding domain-containing protein n=1 Tax=Propioniciclava sp. TaxID=2038686 RepID=UPI0039E55B41
MTTTIGADDLLRLRMHTQRLGADAVAGQIGGGVPEARPAERVAASVRHMLAMQGQDWKASRWAVGIRTPGSAVADVAAAFNEGLIVRSWPVRGTIHIVAAEDVGWMQDATNAGPLVGAPKRRAYLGITDAMLDRLVEVSIEALTTHDSLDRDEISTFWDEAGLEWKPNWRYHLVWWLCQNGHATFGPIGETGEPRLVLASRWIRSPRSLTGDEAFSELAARYAAPRGAVRATDLAWWAGISVPDARRALTLAVERGSLVPLVLDGARGAASQLWADPEALDSAGAVPDWLLLPGFDEHLLGYKDRDPQFDAAAHLNLVVPGRNGVFRATVVRDGRAVGTWQRSTRKREGVAITPFPGEHVDPDALRPHVDRWTAFHDEPGIPITIRELDAPREVAARRGHQRAAAEASAEARERYAGVLDRLGQ